MALLKAVPGAFYIRFCMRWIHVPSCASRHVFLSIEEVFWCHVSAGDLLKLGREIATVLHSTVE